MHCKWDCTDCTPAQPSKALAGSSIKSFYGYLFYTSPWAQRSREHGFVYPRWELTVTQKKQDHNDNDSDDEDNGEDGH